MVNSVTLQNKKSIILANEIINILGETDVSTFSFKQLSKEMGYSESYLKKHLSNRAELSKLIVEITFLELLKSKENLNIYQLSKTFCKNKKFKKVLKILVKVNDMEGIENIVYYTLLKYISIDNGSLFLVKHLLHNIIFHFYVLAKSDHMKTNDINTWCNANGAALSILLKLINTK